REDAERPQLSVVREGAPRPSRPVIRTTETEWARKTRAASGEGTARSRPRDPPTAAAHRPAPRPVRPLPRPRAAYARASPRRRPHRPGVQQLGQQRAERQNQGGARPPGQIEDRAAVGAPLQVRLDGYPDDEIAVEAGRAREGEIRGRPDDLPLVSGFRLEAHEGPRQTEMIELFRVDA